MDLTEKEVYKYCGAPRDSPIIPVGTGAEGLLLARADLTRKA